MKTRTFISALVGMQVAPVLFGAGVIAVLMIPALKAHAALLLPAVIVASFVAAPLIAWKIAPRLRARNWGYPASPRRAA